MSSVGGRPSPIMLSVFVALRARTMLARGGRRERGEREERKGGERREEGGRREGRKEGRKRNDGDGDRGGE